MNIKPKPLVIAFHVAWTNYGTWLPNDPRGSWSEFVRNDEIAALGEPHFGRRKVQPQSPVIRDFYARATPVLEHPVLRYTARERGWIGEAYNEVIQREKYTCYACAIMPDHMHLVLRKHRHDAEDMVQQLRNAARTRLIAEGLCSADHPVWTSGDGWRVFLYHPDDVRRTIRYVENNPIKARLPAQHWSFVKPYDNWPLHEGHSFNSPYARGLRAIGRYP